jgi:hypothetical protein
MDVTLLEAFAAVLLLVGSVIVLYTVWSADQDAEPTSAAQPAVGPAQREGLPLRRAA